MQYKDAFLMPIDRKGIHFPPFELLFRNAII